ncbi:MAG: hypothetical protein IPJ40_13525 [Saprospirales bacterium]|nr:hypothetical protein [Saprospirales bacterium]
MTDGACPYADSAVVLPGADPQAVILNTDSACVKEPYIFMNGSIDATEYFWFIDGALESQGRNSNIPSRTRRPISSAWWPRRRMHRHRLLFAGGAERQYMQSGFRRF